LRSTSEPDRDARAPRVRRDASGAIRRAALEEKSIGSGRACADGRRSATLKSILLLVFFLVSCSSGLRAWDEATTR
jgi:hypothetical protein